ncbi:MAG: gamma-glutamyl-gamma-aminobutyrate hydrolase family protein [Candidatus Eremiobacteraeota bacterium]|nr:gamma-glutamyl-gamma-aminobutyrate hydrolase family protein [Candidatus Eremiobacteraeota bacterium]
MRPRVAITVNPAEASDANARLTYRRAVECAGGDPVLLEPVEGVENIAASLAAFDGLLVPGGKDLAPHEYGGRPHPAVLADSPQRDAFELDALRLAKASGLPTLAICRGVQVMNVALGGSLYEDIADQYRSPSGAKIRHVQTPEHARSDTTHPVDIVGGSKTAAILGSRSLATNSMHHQALRRVAFDLAAVATARDGIVEAVELKEHTHPFFIGVQWHPEELIDRDAPSRMLFARFVREAAMRAESRVRSAESTLKPR